MPDVSEIRGGMPEGPVGNEIVTLSGVVTAAGTVGADTDAADAGVAPDEAAEGADEVADEAAEALAVTWRAMLACLPRNA